jgi:hypothetical protein
MYVANGVEDRQFILAAVTEGAPNAESGRLIAVSFLRNSALRSAIMSVLTCTGPCH